MIAAVSVELMNEPAIESATGSGAWNFGSQEESRRPHRHKRFHVRPEALGIDGDVLTGVQPSHQRSARVQPGAFRMAPAEVRTGGRGSKTSGIDWQMLLLIFGLLVGTTLYVVSCVNEEAPKVWRPVNEPSQPNPWWPHRH